MSQDIVAAEWFVIGALLFIGGVIALAALVWMLWLGVAAMAKARAHWNTANEQEALVEESHAALDEVRSRPAPTDEDLRDSAREMAAFEQQQQMQDITTARNEDVEERPLIEPDSFYRSEE